MIEVELPDGQILEVDTDDQQQAIAAGRKYLASQQAGATQPPAAAPAEPTAPPPITDQMSTGERFRAGMASGALKGANAVLNTANDLAEWIDGTAIGGAINRAGEAVGLPSTAEARKPMDAYRQEVIARDQPLMDTTAGRAGDIVGTGLVLAPTAFIPGANTYTGAALIGAGSGAALSESGERAGGAAIGAAGGAAGKAVGDAVSNTLRRAVSGVRHAATGKGNVEQAARAAVQEALDSNGLKLDDLPEQARQTLLAEVRAALNVGDAVDPAALGRKADFLALGATPTRGQITRDPQQYAFEQTIQGVQGAGSRLAAAAQDNNRVLIDALNKAGANRTGVDLAVSIDTGKKALRAANQYAGTRKAEIDALYQRARDLNGGDIPLDGADFVNRATAALNDPNDFKILSLPADVKALLKAVTDGDLPLSVGSAEGIKSHLAGASMTATRAGDGNAARAIGKVRDALEMTSPSGQPGADTIAAFNAARAANRKFMGQVEKNPFLKAVIDGESPDDAFRKHFATADIGDVRRAMATIRGDDGAISAVKAEALNFLKRGAIGDSADEVANFSQAGFNRALARISLPRLRAMGFSEQEIGTLRTISRVSSYMQKPPAGSKVNTSNTAGQSYNLLMGMLSKARGGPASDKVGDIAAGFVANPKVPVARGQSPTDVVGRVIQGATGGSLIDLIRGRQPQQ
jgi:hypothetical protein